jgi:hypothetical protein
MARYDGGQDGRGFMHRRAFVLTCLICAGTFAGGRAYSHHSFAVFFQTDKTISVTGVVTEFRFSNPHGLIRLDVATAKGGTESWSAETNSPSILSRRGWTKESIKPGEKVTLEGWPARNGSRYLRLQKATRANGELIGKPFDANAD